jgi:low temperature requirement protein LtrA
LVLAVLWWVWASYAWLTNAADVDTAVVWATLLFATAASFIAALTVPEAFGSHRFLFGGALFAVLSAFVGLYALESRHERELLAAVLRMSRTVVPAAALILGRLRRASPAGSIQRCRLPASYSSGPGAASASLSRTATSSASR